MYSRFLQDLASQADPTTFFTHPDDRAPSDTQKFASDPRPDSKFQDGNTVLSCPNSGSIKGRITNSSFVELTSGAQKDLELSKPSGSSKILSMLNTEDSPCKREVETLTDQEAELFLKLVKLYKNKDFNSPQATC